MAKGSVRKKGKKWYYRFYVEDESGKQVQKEFAGTESKSETEALLRKAMDDYDANWQQVTLEMLYICSRNQKVVWILRWCAIQVSLIHNH